MNDNDLFRTYLGYLQNNKTMREFCDLRFTTPDIIKINSILTRISLQISLKTNSVKICRHLTTKMLTTFSSGENDDKPLSVDDTFVICDNRFVTWVPVSYVYDMGDDSVIK